jgi:cyclopropane-fatty-acyl-phospholipid synthase
MSTPGSSASAIQHHYDVGNDFYRLWLDETLSYSCALWEEGDTLEAAQARKVDYHVAQARASGAERILDVGCGWGGVLRHVTRKHGVKRAVGVTLSEAQGEWIRGWEDPRCEASVQSWRDHEAEAPYDAVFAFGVMEHMVKFGRARAERTATYREFFARCRSWLRPSGRLAVQAITKGSVKLDEQGLHDLRYLTQVFPESDVPRLAEIVHAAEKSFEVVSVRNDRPHYTRTCNEWLKRLQRNRPAAVAFVGEQTVNLFELYLMASARQFEQRHAALVRVTLERV